MRKDPATSTAILLTHYSFELNGKTLPQIIQEWLTLYPNKWVIAAVVEALYQGRYKVNSVNRILANWQNQGQPLHHFDHDFADLFCKKIIKAMIPIDPTSPQTLMQIPTNLESQSQTKKSHLSTPHLSALGAAKEPAKIPNTGIEEFSKLTSVIKVDSL
jgi:hypothetical protein